jgi:hypothetical protein
MLGWCQVFIVLFQELDDFWYSGASQICRDWKPALIALRWTSLIAFLDEQSFDTQWCPNSGSLVAQPIYTDELPLHIYFRIHFTVSTVLNKSWISQHVCRLEEQALF